MAEHFAGAIQIGGPIPRRLLEDFMKQVDGSSRTYGDAPTRITTEEELLAALNPASHWLEIEDDQASGGMFWELEKWLEENGIAYDRQSDAKYEFSAECVYFRPGRGLFTFTGDQDHAAFVPLAKVREVKNKLFEEAAHAAFLDAFVKNVQALAMELDILAPDIEDLPPLTVVDWERVL